MIRVQAARILLAKVMQIDEKDEFLSSFLYMENTHDGDYYPCFDEKYTLK